MNLIFISMLLIVPNTESFCPIFFNADRQIIFHFYKQDIDPTRNDRIYFQKISIKIFELNRGSLQDFFNLSRPSKFYVHGLMPTGFNQYHENYFTQYANAFLEHNDCNFIIIDWSVGAYDWTYVWAKHWRKKVAEKLAELIVFLIIGFEEMREIVQSVTQEKRENCETHLKSITIIGFSLGGHIVAIAAGILRDQGLIIGIIIILDPPKWFFFEKDIKINTACAIYVVVIHTSQLGIYKPMGHVDIYANGKNQPGTKWLKNKWSQSHRRVQDLFLESLYLDDNGDKKFPMIKCLSYDEIIRKKCSVANPNDPYTDANGNKNYMGDIDNTDIQITDRPRGIFYLETNGNSPFSKGEAVINRLDLNEITN